MDIHPILDQHEAIAWDMDKTLIGGVNSDLFRAYIALTPHKRHHVVTFRNRVMANTVWAELHACGLDSKALIRSVESCPEELIDCYATLHRMDDAETRQRVMNGPELTREEFQANSDRFEEWKAERAAALGCTILVDDLHHLVLKGCKKYNVDFFHAETVHKGGKPVSD